MADNAVGNAIFDARKARRWSLAILERKTADLEAKGEGERVPVSTINGIEQGHHAPRPRVLRSLATALGLDYTELMRLAGYLTIDQGDQQPGDLVADPNLQEIAGVYQSLDGPGRDGLVRLVSEAAQLYRTAAAASPPAPSPEPKLDPVQDHINAQLLGLFAGMPQDEQLRTLEKMQRERDQDLRRRHGPEFEAPITRVAGG